MKFFVIVCIAVVAQSSWLAHSSSAWFVPNLLVMLAVLSGFSEKKRDILALALCGGAVVADMLSALPFGSALFSVGAALLALWLLRSFVAHNAFAYVAVAVVVATLVFWGSLWTFVLGVHALGWTAIEASSLSFPIKALAGEMAATFVVMMLVYPVRAWIIS